MKVQEEAKRLSHEKLPDQWQRYILVKWNVLNWEIWILEGIDKTDFKILIFIESDLPKLVFRSLK